MFFVDDDTDFAAVAHTAVLLYCCCRLCFFFLAPTGKKAMWRPSKAAGEEYHPRRQLMVSGDKAHRMFLEWAPYVALKAELLEEDETFTDPGRTTFLSTRCGCLGG